MLFRSSRAPMAATARHSTTTPAMVMVFFEKIPPRKTLNSIHVAPPEHHCTELPAAGLPRLRDTANGGRTPDGSTPGPGE